MGAQVNLLVVARPPKPFNEPVVSPRTFFIRADLDVGVLQRLDKVDGHDLTVLIRIQDLWLAMAAYGLFQDLNARLCLKRC